MVSRLMPPEATITSSEARPVLPAFVLDAFEQSGVPMFLIGLDGRFAWTNQAFADALGDVVGSPFTPAAAEFADLSKRQFRRKTEGGEDFTEFETDLVDRQGARRPTRVTSMALKVDGSVVGVFGQAHLREAAPGFGVTLTPRQREVLSLLADGATTPAMATTLSLSRETVRNHVRAVLRELRAIRGSRRSPKRAAAACSTDLGLLPLGEPPGVAHRLAVEREEEAGR
jgi:PAS domain S-box-containing protein